MAFAQPHGAVTTLLVTTGLRPVATLNDLSAWRVMGLSSAMAEIARTIPREIEILAAEEHDEALAMLLAGDAAALVLPVMTFRHLTLSHPEAQLRILRTLSDAPYAVALRQGEADLQHFLNTWVFLREQDGTLAAIHEAFLEGPRPAVARL